MTQLEFNLYPEEVNVDGMVDKRGIRYIGKAKRRNDGRWCCLADLHGMLCIVEVTITFEETGR